jgi:hypothetical protein
VKELSFYALAEVALWTSIIFKTITLGRGHASGWQWQMAQQAMSIVFGMQREVYIYVIKSIVQLMQAVWGYWQWRKSEAQI